MKKGTVYAVGAAVAAVVLLATAMTLAFAGGGGDGEDGSDGAPSTSTPGRVIDPGIGNGQPPATSGPGIAPGEPTPPRSRPDDPISNRDPTPVQPTLGPTPRGQTGIQRVLAPIESAEIVIRESFPPQYAVQVKAGLPSGCAKPDGFEVTRAGSDVRVAVYNTLPTGPVACTAIYGIYDLSINLGTDFVSGQEYQVNVNGTQLRFRAQ